MPRNSAIFAISDPQLGYQLILQVAKLLAHRLEGARVQLAAA